MQERLWSAVFPVFRLDKEASSTAHMIDSKNAFASLRPEQVVSFDLADKNRLQSEYSASRHPFLHLVIDNFLNDEVARRLAREISSIQDTDYRVSFRSLTQRKLQLGNIQGTVPQIYPLYDALMGPSFTRLIELVCRLSEPRGRPPIHRSGNATLSQRWIQRNSPGLESAPLRFKFTSPGKPRRVFESRPGKPEWGGAAECCAPVRTRITGRTNPRSSYDRGSIARFCSR